ncbi:MAG: UDP-3-O-(3-hydroxymyristoyl)glucosamine N-acyltransferase [Acetobacteraceae bacterium]|nr:UDP-3-O-(3-hydroxymyristoyl)glucosamine N-acyltransferase [Acetobacteraceae bacterium]
MAADPRFFATAGPINLAAILTAARIDRPVAADPSIRFSGVGSLAGAGPDEVSFLDNRRYLEALRATRAGAVLVAPAFADAVPAGCLALPTPAAYLGFIRIARLFHPPPVPRPGVHHSAVVGEGATIGDGTEIGPGAVIGEGARIGARCIIGAQVVIGPGVEVGDDCRLHPHCTVSHALLGRGVVLHPGARIGQEGFGFVPTPDGRFETAPQLGRVILGDGVEVGANSCVDRGAQEDTVIGPGTRLDNLVQVGHNVRTGRGCILVAQAGISGSTGLGDYVTVAAQAGLTGHLQVGAKARIGAQSGVMNDVPAGADVLGSPAWPVRETWRAVAALKKLATGKGGATKAD